jgi:hypothetical protein
VDSPEAQIIADAYEFGFGHTQVLWLVNQHAKEMGKESYTMSPIKTCMKNLGPKRLGYKRKCQGSSNLNSPWAKARLNWDTQLLA